MRIVYIRISRPRAPSPHPCVFPSILEHNTTQAQSSDDLTRVLVIAYMYCIRVVNVNLWVERDKEVPGSVIWGHCIYGTCVITIFTTYRSI